MEKISDKFASLSKKLFTAIRLPSLPILISVGALIWTINVNKNTIELNNRTIKLDFIKSSPQIDIETDYAIVKHNDSITTIEMKIKLKNLSANKLNLYRARFKVYGCMVTLKMPSDIKDQYFEDSIPLDGKLLLPTPKGDNDSLYTYAKSSFYNLNGKLIEIGKLECETGNFSFSPNETHNTLKAIIVPAKYNLIKVIIYLHYGDCEASYESQRGTNISEIFIR